MSKYDYEMSKKISEDDPPFTSLIMAAVRKADPRNMLLLASGWPEIVEEVHARYNAPGGLLPGERSTDG